MRTRLRARLDAPSPLELIAYSVKNRMQQKAADRGNVRYNAYIVTLLMSGEEVMLIDTDQNLFIFLGREHPAYKDKYYQRSSTR
jgi:hypothetical protein